MKLRNISKFKWLNDGIRTLNESIVYPEVAETLEDWKKYSKTIDDAVLIGGVALSYYLKPRPTEDDDLIFLTYEDIPESVYKFTKPRDHAFKHIKTHVEVEVLDPDHLKKSKKFFEQIFTESVLSDEIRVASPRSIIALKLQRYSIQDKADIDNLIQFCKSNNIKLDFSEYDLSDLELNNLDIALNESNNFSQNSHMLECASLFRDKKYLIKHIENDIGYDIFVTNEKSYDDPSFYFGKNVGNNIMMFDDFSYLVKIPENINEDLEVVYSSTDYKSFTGRKDEYNILQNWIKENLEDLNKSWKKLNKL